MTSAAHDTVNRSTLLRGRYALFAGLLILAGLANNAASLGWGFMYDDWMQQGVLRGLFSDDHLRPWNLFDFFDEAGSVTATRDALGMQVWWTDPDCKIRFFRPSDIVMRIDYTPFFISIIITALTVCAGKRKVKFIKEKRHALKIHFHNTHKYQSPLLTRHFHCIVCNH